MNLAPHTFVYDNFHSDSFGLRFSHFDTSEHTTLGGGLTYSTFYCKGSHRNIITSAHQTEDNVVTLEVEMMAENGLFEDSEKVVYNALFNNLGYKKLVVNNVDGVDYYINCLFTDPERILGIVEGGVATIGYRCNAVLDSSWIWKDKLITLSGNGLKSVNLVTQIKDYTYPIVTINIGSSGGDVYLTNTTDNNRITGFESLSPNTAIVMYPDYCYIEYSGNGNIWNKFYNKHFLRLLPGSNSINVQGNVTSVNIEYKEAHIL